MKSATWVFCVVLSVVAALAGAATSFAAPSKPPSELIPCRISSWSPEVVTFFGDHATVARKLGELETNLLERRMYLIAVESRDGARLSLFERVEGENVSLSQWETEQEGDLELAIGRTLLKNRGQLCAGELTKSLLKTFPAARLAESRWPAPKTVPAAYEVASTGVEDGAYLRVSVLLLC